ncbi:MAG TPA: right-handed parallel beta-helix repeat-containing protein [bacterium]|nr:right-handed parallel beta-helix repeat-containing protein [bacterium]
MNRSALRSASAVLFLLAFAGSAPAVTWNVNPQGTGDAPTIQAAFDRAAPGDIVLLAPGTYTGVRQRPAHGGVITKAVAFAAPGVNLASSGGPDVTIIDAEFLGHCIVGASVGALEISGITFTRGRPEGEYSYSALAGGGAYFGWSSVTFEGCVFHRCVGSTVDIDGASAIFLFEGSSSVIRSCLFRDNYAGDIGGAVGLYRESGTVLENNTFVRNHAEDGGGAIEINDTSVTLDRNIFAFNSAVLRAGAIVCLGTSTVSGSCNLFWGNTAWVDPDMTAWCSFLGSDENVVADPLFCGLAADDFTIRSDSPAADDDPSGCGLRGALPVACGAVHVEGVSWGRVKAGYRSR